MPEHKFRRWRIIWRGTASPSGLELKGQCRWKGTKSASFTGLKGHQVRDDWKSVVGFTVGNRGSSEESSDVTSKGLVLKDHLKRCNIKGTGAKGSSEEM